MYNRFEATNFRRLRQLKLEQLRRTNLIAGKNGAGKTTLLEALFIHVGGYNVELATRVDAMRFGPELIFEVRRGASTLWERLFTDLNLSQEITLRGTSDAGSRFVKLRAVTEPDELKKLWNMLQRSPTNEGAQSAQTLSSSQVFEVLQLRTGEDGPSNGAEPEDYYMVLDSNGLRSQAVIHSALPGVFLPARVGPGMQENVTRFGKLEELGRVDQLLEALRILDGRIRDVATVVKGTAASLYCDIGLKKKIPLALLGDGAIRIASLVLAMADATGGVVLVDEVENGIHFSLLKPFWSVVGEAAKLFNVQLFATTHSYECVKAAHDAFSATLDYDFALHRLDIRNGEVAVVTYDKESLEGAIETGLEVR